MDPRPLALFRVALGLAILHDLVDLTPDIRAFLTDDGMLPRGTVRGIFSWSLLDLTGSPLGVGLFYAMGFVAVLSFTVGFRTRAATLASWVFLASINHRNDYIKDGGDDLVRILLFWGLFADVGAAYSVDACRRVTRVVDVPAFGLRLLQLQIAVLYFCAARLKFRHGWLHGDNIFMTLQLLGFVRPLGALLGTSRLLCRWATNAIVGMEFLFAFAAFSPLAIRTTRMIAIALGLMIQLGILFTMRVGIFTEAMLTVMFLFVLPEWVDRAEAWTRPQIALAPDTRDTSTIQSPWPRQAVNALVSLQFILAIWGMFAARRFPLPKVIEDEVRLVDLEASYGLFDLTYPIPRWEAPGVLVDGTPVEVLSVVAPGAMPRSASTRFSRWNKLTFKEQDHPLHFPELSTYFCKKYDEETHGPRLASFTLVDRPAFPEPPSGHASPLPERVLGTATCP